MICMSHQRNEKELWEIIGYVKISPTRYKTLKNIDDGVAMPSEIAKSTGLRITQVSNALHDLKEKELVLCLNEEATKGRLYQSTDFGLEVLDFIENNKRPIR